MDALSESCESILTRRANQRHYCIVAQFVKSHGPPQALGAMQAKPVQACMISITNR